MLRTIDRKLERFETSVSRIQVVVTNFFQKTSILSTPLKTRTSLLHEVNRLRENHNNDKRLNNLEMILDIQQLFDRFKDMQPSLMSMTTELDGFRQKVQQSRNFRDDASWVDSHPGVLMGRFEATLASVQDELQPNEAIELSDEERAALHVLGIFLIFVMWVVCK
jgi:archaellum component FlaC